MAISAAESTATPTNGQFKDIRMAFF